MKQRALFIGILLLAISLSCYAQFNNIYLGPEGGPGLGILWGSTNAKQYRIPLAAGTAGYAFQYNFTKIIAIRTDLSYERAGADYSYAGGIRIIKNKFDYMTLPLLVRATFGKKIGFFVDAGSYFGILLRENDVVEEQYFPKTTTNNTGYFKQFDTGITEGLGVLIPIGNSYAVSFETRNNTGLYNLEKPTQYVYQGNFRNNTTNFIFAFIYKLVTRKPAPKQKT